MVGAKRNNRCHRRDRNGIASSHRRGLHVAAPDKLGFPLLRQFLETLVLLRQTFVLLQRRQRQGFEHPPLRGRYFRFRDDGVSVPATICRTKPRSIPLLRLLDRRYAAPRHASDLCEGPLMSPPVPRHVLCGHFADCRPPVRFPALVGIVLRSHCGVLEGSDDRSQHHDRSYQPQPELDRQLHLGHRGRRSPRQSTSAASTATSSCP